MSTDDSDSPDSLHSIRSGVLMRGLALAKLSLGAGSRIASHKLENLFSGDDPTGQRLRALLLAQAKALATELGQLKGSVMKVGQMLSMYGEHFLPPEINSVLKSLQFQSPPLEWKAIHKVLIKELGEERLAQLEISKKPLACASLGQVHRATIKATGETICLKVQYPGVDRAIDSDLKALKAFLSMAQLLPRIPHLDQIFAEVREMLELEVDYEQELKGTDFFRNAFKDCPHLVVPTTHPQFSTRRVLATSYEEGVCLDSEAVRRLSQARRNALGACALEVFYKEFFDLGVVQTDPHLGNYRVRIGQNGEPDQLVLYDFGALRKFDASFLRNYKLMVRSALAGDAAKMREATDQLGFSHPDDPEEIKKVFVEFCFMMVEPFLDSEAKNYNWADSTLPKRLSQKLGSVIFKYKLRSPPREALFLDRKIGGVFIMLAVLRADMNARPLLDRYLDSTGAKTRGSPPDHE